MSDAHAENTGETGRQQAEATVTMKLFVSFHGRSLRIRAGEESDGEMDVGRGAAS